MFQSWVCLTFLHWQYPAEAIRPLLPSGLQPDTFGGAAWIALTPFTVAGLRPPLLPALPWISTFPEMNLRTYVRGPQGGPGIWFFSLEAASWAAVLGARVSYGLPYRWADMRVNCGSQEIEYVSRRRFSAARATIVVRPGAAIEPDELEVFLTARFRLYSALAGRLVFADVEHAPWPLASATLLRFEQNLIEYSGLPKPDGEPLVHFSPGVRVRVGAPTFVR